LAQVESQAVGIIGVGEIGWRMGKLLRHAGHQVIGFDLQAAAMNRARDSDFVAADSIADLCRKAKLVITCVTDGAALREVITGENGLADNLAAGTPVIDTTSAEPWITAELAAVMKSRGIPFLDAPVSGGVPAADQGKMNFMVGGDPAVIERCRCVLERLGPVITHVGPVGAGHTIKTINMLALAASMLSTSELVALGILAGESPDNIVARLNAGHGASYSTRVHFPKFIVPGNYASGFTFDLMLKDLSIGIQLADRFNVPLFLQRTTFELYRAAAHNGSRGSDNTRMVEPVLSNAAATGEIRSAKTKPHQLELFASATNAVIAAESICLGAAAGIRPQTVIEVLSAGSGESWSLSHNVAEYLQSRTRKTGPALGDVWNAGAALFAEVIKSTLPTPLLNQAFAIHASAIGSFGPNEDCVRVIDLIASWAGQRERLKST
jgi:3-hydroxyisobutyrate dehydrogenase-like beta-hydroxyacid dehydrogenase